MTKTPAAVAVVELPAAASTAAEALAAEASPAIQAVAEIKPASNVVQYVVLRAKQTQPEILIAGSDEEAWEIIDKQVRLGKTPVVYLFKLLGASCYQPSSIHVTPQEILDGGIKSRTLNLETSSNDN